MIAKHVTVDRGQDPGIKMGRGGSASTLEVEINQAPSSPRFSV